MINTGTNSALRPTVVPIKTQLSRYFTEFDSVAQSYILLSSPITLTGDFFISFKARIPSAGAYFLADTKTNVGPNRLAVNNAGRLYGMGFTGTASQDISELDTDGNIYRFTIQRTNGNITLNVGGVVCTTTGTDAIVLDGIGSQYGGSTSVPYMHGPLFDLEIWKGGDRATGTKILDMPIDRTYNAFSPYVKNHVLNLGEPINTVTEQPWDGTEGSYGAKALGVNSAFAAGSRFLVTYKIEHQAGQIKVNTSGTDQVYISESGYSSFVTVDDTTFLSLQNGPEGSKFVGQISEIAVYEIPADTPIGTVRNITLSDSEVYVQREDGNWLGQEIYTQERWAGEHDSTHAAWTYDDADNTWNMEGNGDPQALNIISIAENPDVAWLEATFLETTGNMVPAQTLSPFSWDEAGTKSGELKKKDTTRQQFKRGDGDIVNCKLARPSFRPYLNISNIPEFKPKFRNFTKFDSVATTHVRLPKPLEVSVNDGFEIEIDFVYRSNGGSGVRLLGNSVSSPANLVKVFNSDAATDAGKINFALNGGFLSNTGFMDSIEEGTFNRITLTGSPDDGGTVKFALNGKVKQTDTGKGGLTGQYDFIGGGAGSADYANDIVASVRAWTGGDRTTGTLVLDLPISGPYSSGNPVVWSANYSEQPVLREQMEKPFTNVAPYSTTASSTAISLVNGEMHIERLSTGSSWLAKIESTDVPVGTYLMKVEFDEESFTEWDGGLGLQAYSTTDSSQVRAFINISSKTGYCLVDNETENNTIFWIIAGGSASSDIGKTVRVKEFSVRPVNQLMGEIYNVSESYTQEYQQYEEGYWVGPEIIENGKFEEGGTSWTQTGDGWTFNEGYAERDGSPDNDGIDQTNVFEQGKQYRLLYEVSNRTQGNLIPYIGQGTQQVSVNTSINGFIVSNFTSNVTASKLLLNGTNSFDGRVLTVSVKQLISSNY